MATLLSVATGNFNTMSTWLTCEAAASIVSEAGQTTVTTTATGISGSFTPGAVQYRGIAFRARRRIGSTGTVTVELYNVTDGTVDASGSANMSQLNSVGNTTNGPNVGLGYYFVQFSADFTTTAGKAYRLRLKTSSSNQLEVYTNGTASNWTAELVTTTAPGSLGAGDNFIIAGKITTSSASSYTVTYDYTSSTDFGWLSVGNYGTLTQAVSASTNYLLKVSGDIRVYSGGTINWGTSGSRLPSTSTLVVTVDCTSAVEFGIIQYGTGIINVYGTSKTSILQLAADAASGATSLTLSATPTAWKSGDELLITTTNSDASQSEVVTLGADAGSATITVSALANDHAGTGNNIAYVANLTRNIKIQGASSSNTTYWYAQGENGGSTTTRLDECCLKWFGSSTTNKRGVEFAHSSASNLATITDAVFRNFTSVGSIGLACRGAINGSTVTITNMVTYDIYTTHIYGQSGQIQTASLQNTLHCSNSDSAAGILEFYTSAYVFNNAVVVGGAGYGILLYSLSSLGTFTSARVCACDVGCRCETIGHSSTIYAISGLVVEDCVTSVFYLHDSRNLTISLTAHNIADSSVPLDMSNNQNITFDPLTLSSEAFILWWASFAGMNVGFKFLNSTLSFDGGAFRAYPSNLGYLEAYAYNLTIAGISFTSIDPLGGRSIFISHKEGNTAGNHIDYRAGGNIAPDTTFYKAATPARRMTPKSATVKLESLTFCVPVQSGKTCRVSVWVRKSATGDGANYNGAQPRLIVREDRNVGYTADTVLATAAAANGSWEQLVATTSAASADGAFEFYVDCSGTVGWVTVDDWDALSVLDPGSGKYIARSGTLQQPRAPYRLQPMRQGGRL